MIAERLWPLGGFRKKSGGVEFSGRAALESLGYTPNQDKVTLFFVGSFSCVLIAFLLFFLFVGPSVPKLLFQPRLTSSAGHKDNLIRRVSGLLDKGPSRSREQKRALATLIVNESLRSNFDPLFIAAVIQKESTFNRSAVSPVGAVGLMQLLPSTGQYISKKENLSWNGSKRLKDSGYNIRLGIAYLNELDSLFRGNWEHILMAYNWGPGNVQSALKTRSRIPSSVKNYARSVISTHSRWRKEDLRNLQQARGDSDILAG